MKKSLIWTAAGVAAIGLAAPAFAAHRADDVRPVVSIPTTATVPSTVASSVASIAPSGNSVQPVTVNSVSDDAATHDSLDDNGVDATVNSVDEDSATHDSLDDNGVDDNGLDATVNSAAGSDDPANHDANEDVRHSGTDDGSGHDLNDDSGHGGSDD